MWCYLCAPTRGATPIILWSVVFRRAIIFLSYFFPIFFLPFFIITSPEWSRQNSDRVMYVYERTGPDFRLYPSEGRQIEDTSRDRHTNNNYYYYNFYLKRQLFKHFKRARAQLTVAAIVKHFLITSWPARYQVGYMVIHDDQLAVLWAGRAVKSMIRWRSPARVLN